MARLGYAKAPYSPTRFPAGITNANVGTVLGNYADTDPTKLQVFFEDFIAAPADLGTFTAVAGAGGLATVATTVTVGTPLASFALSLNRRFFFKARLSLATVANGVTVGFGDALTATTAGVTVTIANNVLTLQQFGGTAQSASATVATANATMYEVGFEYSPNEGITAYLNDVPVARLRGVAALPSADMIAGVRPNGATATVDYLLAAVER